MGSDLALRSISKGNKRDFIFYPVPVGSNKCIAKLKALRNEEKSRLRTWVLHFSSYLPRPRGKASPMAAQLITAELGL